MIIDAHTHIGRKTMVANPAEMVQSMNEAGIAASLVFAGFIADCSNEQLLNDTAPYADRLLPVCMVAPTAPLICPEHRLLELARLLHDKLIVAAKFYSGYDHFYPYDRMARPYLNLLAEYGVPAIFHTGDCYCKVNDAKLKYAHPLHLDELAVDMPNLTIVMAHMGNPWLIDGAEVCYKNPNVFADCSGFVCGDFNDRSRERYIAAIRSFMEYVETPEKLLFGTDWPITDQASYVKATLEALQGDSRATEAVMAANAVRVYGLGDRIMNPVRKKPAQVG